jgi:hypothetical protein
MARHRIDELKSGDVTQLIGLLGKIGFSPVERGKINVEVQKYPDDLVSENKHSKALLR